MVLNNTWRFVLFPRLWSVKHYFKITLILSLKFTNFLITTRHCWQMLILSACMHAYHLWNGLGCHVYPSSLVVRAFTWCLEGHGFNYHWGLSFLFVPHLLHLSVLLSWSPSSSPHTPCSCRKSCDLVHNLMRPCWGGGGGGCLNNP